MSAIPKYTPHYTVADYAAWDGDWELWRGVPVAMSLSRFGVHQWIAGRIFAQCLKSLEATCQECFVLYEIDRIVSDDTVVRPDVLIGCGPFPHRHVIKPPTLVAEVLSPSTSHKDLTAERELYRSQNVDHYLIADPESKPLQWIRIDANEPDYVLQPAASNLEIELKTGCVVQLMVDSLFLRE